MASTNVVAFRKPSRDPAADDLAAFALRWFDLESVLWRPSTVAARRSLLRAHVIPLLSGHALDGLSRAEVVAFRARLARTPTVAGRPRSATYTNAALRLLGWILAERERQHSIPNPCVDLRRLPEPRTDVRPFSLPQLLRLRDVAPDDLREYIWIRALTALRSGEVNGLRWTDVDLDAGTFEVRESRVNGRQQPTKNHFSRRVIAMIPSVREAFERQHALTQGVGYVFQTPRGCAIDSRTFAKRQWPRLLQAANLAHRPPEALRHTGATLMLAAGEAPTHVARLLGHADLTQLLRTYARFMPGALGTPDGARRQAALGPKAAMSD